MIRGIKAMDLLTQPTAEKLVKNQEQINQLHEVLALTRIDKQNALVRRLVKKQQDGTLGQPDTGDAAVSEEEETVSFGDTTYNISGGPAKVVDKTIPSILPYVLAAALGGAGLGAAALAIPALLKPAATVQAAGADTNTEYNLGFGD